MHFCWHASVNESVVRPRFNAQLPRRQIFQVLEQFVLWTIGEKQLAVIFEDDVGVLPVKYDLRQGRHLLKIEVVAQFSSCFVRLFQGALHGIKRLPRKHFKWNKI